MGEEPRGARRAGDPQPPALGAAGRCWWRYTVPAPPEGCGRGGRRAAGCMCVAPATSSGKQAAAAALGRAASATRASAAPGGFAPTRLGVTGRF